MPQYVSYIYIIKRYTFDIKECNANEAIAYVCVFVHTTHTQEAKVSELIQMHTVSSGQLANIHLYQ